MEYLDSTIGREAAMQFHRLGTTEATGAPGRHAESSYQAHRSFLLRLAAEVDLGEVRTKARPKRSGEVLPLVESFVYTRHP
jgi:hypothetical protein